MANSEAEGRRPADSQITLSQIMDQHHTNLLGTVHGGQILKLIDSVAGVVAARITWAGRSSMEVAVVVTADRWDRAVPATTVVTSHLVMVGVDADGKPRTIPRLIVESEDELRDFRRAEIRREHRLALRKALA